MSDVVQEIVAARSRKTLTLQQAAGVAGVSPDTVARWCKRYGIGKQLHWKAPWRVDPAGLAVVMVGDPAALERYHDATLSRRASGAASARNQIRR